jgi:hypothetical protein
MIMFLRKILLAALVAAPLAWSPATVFAQERGTERAAVATAQANATAGWTNSRATNRPSELPAGVAARFQGETLPPGIDRTRPQTAPVPEPVTEPCPVEAMFVNGQLVFVDCNGDVVNPMG